VANQSLPRVDLNPELEIDLTPSQETLLQQLFAGCDYLEIKHEFSEGMGGTRVFQVVPWRNGSLAPLVVKIGPSNIITDEKERYEQYIRDRLPLIGASIERFTSQDNLAAIAYIYLGGTALGQETYSLKEYYQRQPPKKILEALKYLLVNTLGTAFFNARHIPLRPRIFEDFYGFYFPGNLWVIPDHISQAENLAPSPTYKQFSTKTPIPQLRRIELDQAVHLDGFQIERQKHNRIDLLDSSGRFRIQVDLENFPITKPLRPDLPVSVQGRVGDRRQERLAKITTKIFSGITKTEIPPTARTITLADQTFPNPLTIFQSYLNQPFAHNVSIIHGDLHLFNVIVDGFHKPWLIDFARVREGHTIFDFIELEAYLRDAILSRESFPLADIVDFEQRLICATVEAESPKLPINPDLAKAFEVIRGIRGFAANYLARPGNFKGEYFPALFLYSLGSLKYYDRGGHPAARHAFITATMVGTYLQDQLNCQELLSMQSLVDSGFELYVYYLKKATDDTFDQRTEREQAFVTQLQRAADAVREKLGVDRELVTWPEDPKDNLNQMVRRYYSGQWQDVHDTTRAWLAGYEMNDTYIFRLTVYQPGSEQSPDILTRLAKQLRWQPDPDVPGYLGQSLFYSSRVTEPTPSFAGTILDNPSLWHTSLTCGELYCRPAKQTPYLLLYTEEQEPLVAEFFDRLAPQLGWYSGKAYRQQAEYENYLRPLVSKMAQALSTAQTEAQTLHRQLDQHQTALETLTSFHERVQSLENYLLEFDSLLTVVTEVQTTIQINTDNYRRVTKPDEFLIKAGENQIFVQQQRFLDVLPDQLKIDLERWQRLLTQVRDALNILHAAAERFPLPVQDLTSVDPSSQTDFEADDPIVSTQVTVRIEGDINLFTRPEQGKFIFELASLLQTTPNQIRILKIDPGSILITLAMPRKVAEILLSIFQVRPFELQRLHIIDVQLPLVKTQSETSLFERFEINMTVMFDDIKDSTPYVFQYGDQNWLALVQQHDDLLHPIIAAHKGRVINNLGDGSLSIFPNATQAVQAAQEIQSELQRFNGKAKPLNQLHIRLGLHTGQAIVRGDDILGLAVHIASRICGKADAGEIVISETTYQAAGDVALDCENLGQQKLKGIPEPITLYRKSLQE